MNYMLIATVADRASAEAQLSMLDVGGSFQFSVPMRTIAAGDNVTTAWGASAPLTDEQLTLVDASPDWRQGYIAGIASERGVEPPDTSGVILRSEAGANPWAFAAEHGYGPMQSEEA